MHKIIPKTSKSSVSPLYPSICGFILSFDNSKRAATVVAKTVSCFETAMFSTIVGRIVVCDFWLSDMSVTRVLCGSAS